ncbi:ArsR/SmtB family transcription factor [Streptomyces flavofungini]|uniref:Winged helix-turn-helix transcriptional regulator n=1 Tax=Streptomyces flavofungini TaxID=68200 RepID=A0ABS0WZA0_9ACTN|nr:winged helix-turn-helix transcriptional regulator [Streptomyces flavofungini]GHC46351.1 transcriptional regulator [Streptomyces flavofungini]
MLRVHFTATDLVRTRVSDGADPLWETVLSLHRLQDRRPDPALAAGRRSGHGDRRGPLGMLLPLVPRRGYFPDFLTPPAAAAGLEHGLEALMCTPRTRLRAELAVLGDRNPLPSWTRSLADGEPAALRRLARALRTYHQGTLGPDWSRVTRRAHTDRALRLHALWHGGAEAMLRTYGPSMRWRSPVLEVAYPVDRDLRLDGRGLLLVPSCFARSPVALADTALPPTLVYPVRPRPADAARPAYEGLAPLLGHTRAAVLQALGGDPTTTELARRAGVSLSSASEHAAVLREAGLVSSVRQSNAVHHVLTPLGSALLRGNQQPVVGVPPAPSELGRT